MNLAEFKTANPAYQSVPDAELADALHAKYYASIPKTEFYTQIGFGETKPVEVAPPPVEEKSFLSSVVDNATSIAKGVAATNPFFGRAMGIAQGPQEKKIGSVLEGQQMPGVPFDTAEAERLSRRDYAESREQEQRVAKSPEMRETRAPLQTDRQRFAEQNPITAGFAQSAASTLAGTLNVPSVVAGLAGETVNRTAQSMGVEQPAARVPNMPLVNDLRSVGQEYASQLSRKDPGKAWDDGDFGRWMLTQMSGNSFSAAQSLGALFVPGAQASLLASMGGVAAGGAYADGDSASAATMKGLVEVGSEMLPLKAAEKIKDVVLAIPTSMRNQVLAEAGKRLLAAGTAVTTNSMVGAIEEVAAEVGGNAIDKYISGKDKSLFENVDRAAIVGAAFGTAFSAPAVSDVMQSPQTARSRELSSAIQSAQFVPAETQRTIEDTLRTEGPSIIPAATSMDASRAAVQQQAIAQIGQASSADEAIAAAQQALSVPVVSDALPDSSEAIAQRIRELEGVPSGNERMASDPAAETTGPSQSPGVEIAAVVPQQGAGVTAAQRVEPMPEGVGTADQPANTQPALTPQAMATQPQATETAQQVEAPTAMQLAFERARSSAPAQTATVTGGFTPPAVATSSTEAAPSAVQPLPAQSAARVLPASQTHQRLAATLQQSIRERQMPNVTFKAVGIPPGPAGKSLVETRDVARKLFGMDAVFVQFDGDPLFAGAVAGPIPNTIFINAASDKPHMAVLGHELLHQMQIKSPDLYKQLSANLDRLIQGESGYKTKLQRVVQKKGVKLDANWREELHADIVGDHFADPKFWEDMARDQPSTFQKLATAVRQFLNSILIKAKPFGTDAFLSDVLAAREAVTSAMQKFSQAQTREASIAESADALGLQGATSKPESTIQFSTEEKDALSTLSGVDELFALPKSKGMTIADIVRDNDPTIRIRETDLFGEKMYTLTMADGSVARITERPPGKYGPNVYGYDMENGEVVNQITERPGVNPEDAPNVGDVWIDVSNLKRSGDGARVYNIAATYAHNTGQIFIGDPAGLSTTALRRRLEQMISSALKFGTTDHLAPHPSQVRGGSGVPGLTWVYGDSEGNLERMIAASVTALDNAFPNSRLIAYDADSNSFYIASSGRAIDRGQLPQILGRSLEKSRSGGGMANAAEAGWRTVARGAVFRALARRAGEAARAGDGRPNGVLDFLRESGPGLAAGPASDRIFYSRTDGDAGKSSSEDRAVTPAANQAVDVGEGSRIDEDTGLPLNADGTVTVYHHTSKASAELIRKTKRLKSEAEPDVYVTNRRDADTGYGDTPVAVNVRPEQLVIDDEFPNGRVDFRIDTGRPGGSVVIKLADEPKSQPAAANPSNNLKSIIADAEIRGVEMGASERDGIITLSKIVVPQEQRGSGAGTAVMRALVDYADATNQHIALTPSADLGGRKTRLVDFYKRFGFVENKGRNKAFQTSETMYRTAPDRVMFSLSDGASEESQAWAIPEASQLDRIIYELQDSRVDLKRVQESIKAAGKQIEEKFDARTAESLFPGRVAYRSEDFLKAEVRPLLQAMALNKVSMDEMADYLHARGAEERNAQIAKVNPDMPDGGAGTNSKGTLLTNQAAREYLASIPAERKKTLDLLAAKVDAITNGTRKLLVDEGLEKAEVVKAWEGAYKNYVPMFRDEAESGNPHPSGGGFSVRGGNSQRATGSTKAVTNILAHVLMQREAAITKAEKNRVGLALYGLALSNPNTEFWATIRPGMQADQIAADLEAMGVDPVIAESGMQGIPTVRTVDPVLDRVVDRLNPMYKSLPGAITLKIGGEDRVLMLNENDSRALRMAESLKNLDGLTRFDLAGSIVGKTTRWMASVNTQYNPAFGIVNGIRDTFGGAVNLTSTPLRGKSTQVLLDAYTRAGPAIANEIAKPGGNSEWAKLYRQYREDGGQTGYREMFKDANERTKAIEKELSQLESAGKLTPGKAANALLKLLDGFNTTIENAVRLAAYKTALDQGISRPQAAKIARELTVDFNRKGRAGRELGPLYAFFNASVQGAARTIEALQGPAGAKIITGGLALGALQTVMLALAGFDDDEIAEFVKTRAFIIPVPGTEKKYIAVPLPLGLHVIPNTGRVLAELLLNGGKDISKRSFEAIGEVAGAFNPLGGGNIFTADGALRTALPTVIDPIVEIGFNRNFAGNQIERDSRGETDVRPGYARAKESTQRSLTGQAYLGISRAINRISGGTDYEAGLASPTPERLQYLAQVVGGGLLREFEKTINISDAISKGDKVQQNKIPVVGRLFGQVDEDAVQKSRFFEASKKLDKAQAALAAAQKAGDADTVIKMLNEKPELMLAPTQDRISQQIAKLNKLAITTINDRETLLKVDEARLQYMKMLNQAIQAQEEASGSDSLGKRLRGVTRKPGPQRDGGNDAPE